MTRGRRASAPRGGVWRIAGGSARAVANAAASRRVQSSSKHKEDFGHGKASTYIAVGLIATVLFVLTVWGVVQLVVRVAQPT